MRYLLTADEMGAEEAYCMGLVQELAEPGNQIDQAQGIAATISRQAPIGVRATLASAKLAQTKGEKPAFAKLLPDLVPILKSEDFKEGVRSFIERRETTFNDC